MRLAVISDIHGNLPALEAVMGDIARRGVEGIVSLGDLVSGGPNCDEVVAVLEASEAQAVVGNCDLAVLDEDEAQARERYLKKGLGESGREVFSWARQHTGAKAREYLSGLPAQLYIEEDGLTLLFTHGSPERPNEYLGADTPEERLVELFEGTGADIMVVGHTHLPLVREVGERLLINPGSVGAPYDGDPRASYLIIDTEGQFRAEHVRVTFDVESYAALCVSSGLPKSQAIAVTKGLPVE
jgi:putative phosphoesterase